MAHSFHGRDRRAPTLVAALLFALSTAACNRGAADEALQAAERAFAAATEVEAYAPEEFTAVSQIIREARASHAAGRYTDALRAAQPLPDRIATAVALAAKRKEQSATAWNALSTELELRLATLAERLTLLSSRGWISSERTVAAQAALASLSQAWADAKAAQEHGDLPKAVAAARDVEAQADLLAARLGMKAIIGAEPAGARPGSRP